MILEGVKFVLGLGIGSIIMFLMAVLASSVIFQFERLAYRRGWVEEPHRSMPRARINTTVIPFTMRHSAGSPPASKLD